MVTIDGYSSVHEMKDEETDSVGFYLYGQLRIVSRAGSTFAHLLPTSESLQGILEPKSSKNKVAH